MLRLLERFRRPPKEPDPVHLGFRSLVVDGFVNVPCSVSGDSGLVRADSVDWTSEPELVTCAGCRASPLAGPWLEAYRARSVA